MRFFSIPLVLLFGCSVLHSQGRLLEKEVVDSEILGEGSNYSIYLPEGYDNDTRLYPVLYLLHGFTDDDSGWTQFGEVHLAANQMFGQGEVSPMIIVMPDAGLSWYVNDDLGEMRFEEYFFEELIPHIESTYRVRTERQYRAIAGLSMGGFGSLLYALKHPDMFSVACPLSAAVRTDEQMRSMDQARWDFVFGLPFAEGSSGEDRLSDHYLANSPLNIIMASEPNQYSGVAFYIDCGDDDYLLDGNLTLNSVMREKGIAHEFRVRDGGHTWTYWRTALPEVFKFVSARFRR
ncbi:MAG: alpha/beta hydrolase family protein [Bacteroidota bacterium]